MQLNSGKLKTALCTIVREKEYLYFIRFTTSLGFGAIEVSFSLIRSYPSSSPRGIVKVTQDFCRGDVCIL